MLSIFSCAYWPSVYLPWRNVWSGLLPIFWLGCWFFPFLLLSCTSRLHLLDIKPLSLAGFLSSHSYKWKDVQEFPGSQVAGGSMLSLLWLSYCCCSGSVLGLGTSVCCGHSQIYIYIYIYIYIFKNPKYLCYKQQQQKKLIPEEDNSDNRR